MICSRCNSDNYSLQLDYFICKNCNAVRESYIESFRNEFLYERSKNFSSSCKTKLYNLTLVALVVSAIFTLGSLVLAVFYSKCFIILYLISSLIFASIAYFGPDIMDKILERKVKNYQKSLNEEFEYQLLKFDIIDSYGHIVKTRREQSFLSGIESDLRNLYKQFGTDGNF